MDRPNILFINTDQQTWNVVSAYGNPHVRTPHMDRLHRNGTSFMRSYCADPVCSASRASWMTGRYTSENGVCFNAGKFSPGEAQAHQESALSRPVVQGSWVYA